MELRATADWWDSARPTNAVTSGYVPPFGARRFGRFPDSLRRIATAPVGVLRMTLEARAPALVVASLTAAVIQPERRLCPATCRDLCVLRGDGTDQEQLEGVALEISEQAP